MVIIHYRSPNHSQSLCHMKDSLFLNWGPYFCVERFIELSAMHMLKRKALICPGQMGGLQWLFAAGICLLAQWLIYTGTFGLVTSNGAGVNNFWENSNYGVFAFNPMSFILKK